MRYALEVAEAVRAVWPQDRPLIFRVSAVEGPGGVWGIEETLALVRELKQRGVDMVDCSSGGIALGGGDGLADPLQLVHAREAQRLRQLEQHGRAYPRGSAIDIPFGIGEQLPYSWTAGIAGPRNRR